MTSLQQPTASHHYAMPFTLLPLPCRHDKPDLHPPALSIPPVRPLASQQPPWCGAPAVHGSDHKPPAMPGAHALDDPEMYALQTMFAALETRTNQSEHHDSVALSVARQRQQQQSAGTHPAYVEALVDTTAHIIETIWPAAAPPSSAPSKHLPSSPPSSPTSSPSTATTAAAVVSLRTFIQEVLKRSRTTYSTLQTALFYLFRARPAILSQMYYAAGAPPSPPATGPTANDVFGLESYYAWQDAYIHCGRRMFLAALVTASKFVQDKTYRNSTWAKIAGLPVAEINAAERIFLNLIGYRLYIAQPTFERWHHLLHMHVEARAATTATTSTSTWLHYTHHPHHHASTKSTTTRKRRSNSTASQDSNNNNNNASTKKRKITTVKASGRSSSSCAIKKPKRQ